MWIRLLPRVRERVVTVPSDGRKAGSTDVEDLDRERGPYRALAAYARAEPADLLFTSELQRLLSRAGSPVVSTAAHPGRAATNPLRSDGRRGARRLAQKAVVGLFAQSDDDGALPTLHAAVAGVPGDGYAGPSGFLEGRGAPKPVGRPARARDAGAARRLWKASEDLTGVAFPRGSLRTA
ncbi:hypothetical protein [Actinorugispora endophytica]|uniref:hypothetical protein n=1 Tax=Actinorugispora endophytica TaxID=1605990 RepID=UPI00106164C1|nr:hypothetical protein [Actinorugispora endophytica]